MASRVLKRLVPTDAVALGAIRAANCSFVLLEVLLTDFVDLGRLPTTVMRPTGAMQVLPWTFYDALVTPRGMLVLKFLLVLSLAASATGYFTSVSTKLAALLFLFYEGLIRSFGHFNHDEMPVAYILICLAFVSCGDAFSLDETWRRVRRHTGDLVYGYPILLMRCLLAWSYFSSGLIKLRVSGIGYFNADNLPNLAIMHSLDNLHSTHFQFAFWLPNLHWLATLAVSLVILWELTFPLGIISRMARRIILPLGLLFHFLTILFMNLSFPYHVAAYAVFINWPVLAQRVTTWRRAKLLTKAEAAA